MQMMQPGWQTLELPRVIILSIKAKEWEKNRVKLKWNDHMTKGRK